MIIVAAVGAFVGSLLTVSVGTTVFAHDRVRRRRHDRGRPYAL